MMTETCYMNFQSPIWSPKLKIKAMMASEKFDLQLGPKNG
jgi:hypothetical protein